MKKMKGFRTILALLLAVMMVFSSLAVFAEEGEGSQEGGGETPPAQGEEAPVEGGDGPAEPVEGGEDPEAPAAGGDGPAAPVEGGEEPEAPVEGGEKPVEGGEEPAGPVEGGEEPAEPVEGGEKPEAPVVGGEKPVEGGKEPATPVEGGEEPQNVPEGTKGAIPGQAEEQEKSVTLVGAAPAEGEESLRGASDGESVGSANDTIGHVFVTVAQSGITVTSEEQDKVYVTVNKNDNPPVVTINKNIRTTDDAGIGLSIETYNGRSIDVKACDIEAGQQGIIVNLKEAGGKIKIEAAGIASESNNLGNFGVNATTFSSGSGGTIEISIGSQDDPNSGNIVVKGTNNPIGIKANANGNGNSINISTTGNVDVTGTGSTGINASASSGKASIETYNVSADDIGIESNSSNSGSVIVNADNVTAGKTGIKLTSYSGTNEIKVKENVKGEEEGIHVIWSKGLSSVIIGETLSTGENGTAIVLNNDVTTTDAENLNITAWSIEGEGDLVTGGARAGEGTKSAAETVLTNINYIIKLMAGLNGATVTPATSTNTVEIGDETYQTAHENEKVTVSNFTLDEDKGFDGIYYRDDEDESKKVKAADNAWGMNEDGSFWVNMLRGGGMMLGLMTHTHDYVLESVTKAATCTESGTAVYKCSVCGATKQVTVAAKGHTEVTDAAVAATCTTAGKTAGSHCSACGTVIKAQEVIPATGHTEVADAAVGATCTTAGKTAGSHCSECGAVIKAQETVPATGHSPAAAIKENEKAAQIGVAGSYDEVVYCKDCGAEISRKTVTVPALPEPQPEEKQEALNPKIASVQTQIIEDYQTPKGGNVYADSFDAFCNELVWKIRNAPQNGTVEADAGDFPGLMQKVFTALNDRPDVSLKLKTRDGEIVIPAGAGLLEKVSRGVVTWAEIRGLV